VRDAVDGSVLQRELIMPANSIGADDEIVWS